MCGGAFVLEYEFHIRIFASAQKQPANEKSNVQRVYFAMFFSIIAVYFL